MPRQFSILIVDDEPNVADILKRAAINTFPEARFIFVSTYLEAVAYLEGLAGSGPMLVLLDLDLQGELSGFDFLSRVRQHTLGRLIPVIILSGSLSEEHRKEAYWRGATVFTTKPFSFADWKTYVARLRTYWFQTATIPELYFAKSG